MTSTPSVCPTDIEQCLNRPLMTIAAHLLNITISSVSTGLKRSIFLERSGFYFGRTHSSISIELNSSRSNRIQEFKKELGSGKNSRSRLEEFEGIDLATSVAKLPSCSQRRLGYLFQKYAWRRSRASSLFSKEHEQFFFFEMISRHRS